MTESSRKVIINSTISFIYSLVRVIKSLEIIGVASSEIENLKLYLLNCKDNDESKEIVRQVFYLCHYQLTEYEDIYYFFSENVKYNSELDFPFLSHLDKTYIHIFKDTIRDVIAFFPDCDLLFNIKQIIWTEVSESFYQLYLKFRHISIRHAFSCLEKACLMNNFKAKFEFGFYHMDIGNYQRAYNYFKQCSDFPASDPIEVSYIPAMFMIGIMYNFGLFVQLDLEKANNIFTHCQQMNEELSKHHHMDNYYGLNFTRTQQYFNHMKSFSYSKN